MIGIEELEKRINEIIRIFKKRTKVLACYLLDKDGFIIASLTDDFMDNDLYKKKVITLYTVIEMLSESTSDLIDIRNNVELISIFTTFSEYLNNGFMILIKSIMDNLVFMVIFPTLLDLKPIFREFDDVIEELSVYFLDAENQDIWKSLYKLI